MYSEKVETYLKAVYEIEEAHSRAKTSHLSERLGVSAGSVTEMIQRISSLRPKLLDYAPQHGVRLTNRGKKAALQVVRRHRLLETFLHDTLRLSWDEVHMEAQALEHHVSERVADAIYALLGNPTHDPHGEPIPDRRGRLPATSSRRLADVEPGETVRVVRIHPHPADFLPYLDRIGIGIGTEVRLLEKAPMEEPMRISVRGDGQIRERSIGQGAAVRIFVEGIPRERLTDGEGAKPKFSNIRK